MATILVIILFFRESKSLPLDEFIISLIEDISIAKSMFFVGFYNDVTEILRTPHALRGLRGASWRKFLRLITMIVEVQVYLKIFIVFIHERNVM